MSTLSGRDSGCFSTHFIVTLFVIGALSSVWLFIIGLVHVPVSSEGAWPGLMASHILKGETPVIYWGQPYLGTLLSYFHAPLIAVFGPTPFAIRLIDLLSGIAFIGVSYLLAGRVYGRNTAALTVAILAIPTPYLAMAGAIVPPDNYMALITAGSLALWILMGIMERADNLSATRRLIALGVLLGLAFWVHVLMASYVAVVLVFLLIRFRISFLRSGLWVFLVSFIAGSLPLWIYNAVNKFATFADVGKAAQAHKMAATAKALFSGTIHFITGAKVMLYPDNPAHVDLPMVLFIGVSAVTVGLVCIALATRWRDLPACFRRPAPASCGTVVLLVFTVTVLALFCRTARATWDSPRYIFPILSALPILMAAGLWRLWEWSRAAAACTLLLLCICYATGNALLVREWQKPDVMAYALDLPDMRGLQDVLRRNGITHAYAHYWISYRLTYETGMKVVCSQPYNDRFPGYPVKFLDEVRAQKNVAYITHKYLGTDPDAFESHLRHTGTGYRKKTSGVFTVFHDFAPVYGAVSLRELARDGWLVDSSDGRNSTDLILDGRRDTRWTSADLQAKGAWFSVDMGVTQSVCLVWVDLGDRRSEWPRCYQLDVSSDGATWKTVCKSEAAGVAPMWVAGISHPIYMIDDTAYSAAFAPIQARHLRLTLTREDPDERWSIAELRVFGAGP